MPAATGTTGGLVLPAGRIVQLYLESPDVIHAFYVPQFLFKRDVVPGRINIFEFNVDERDRRPDVPRPVRRAVRVGPLGRCSSTCTPWHRRPSSTPGSQEQIAQAPPPLAADRPPSGEPARPAGRTRRQPLRRRQSRPERRLRPADADARRPTRRSRSSSTTRTPSIPHNVAIHEDRRPARASSQGEIFPGRRQADLRRPAARGRRLRLHLLGPSRHDRHPHGRTEEHHRGDHRAPPGRPRLPQHPVRLGDDDRSQEDRDHVPDQLVPLLLPRRAARPGRARRARPAGSAVRDRPDLQRAVHDARHVHDLPVHHPDAGGLRELHRAAPDRRAGHGLPADQRAVAVDAAAGRHPAAAELRTGGSAAAGWTSYAPARRGPPARRRPAPGRTCGSSRSCSSARARSSARSTSS